MSASRRRVEVVPEPSRRMRQTRVDAFGQRLTDTTPNRRADVFLVNHNRVRSSISMGYFGRTSRLNAWRNFPRRFSDIFGVGAPRSRSAVVQPHTRPNMASPRRLDALLPNPANLWTPPTYGEGRHR